MPIMRQKSDENLNAAKLLVKNSMYTASIHCFYYFGFQLSKYVLCNSFQISYNKQASESYGKDSHFYVIDKMSTHIDQRNHIDMLDYMKYIHKLKSLRRKADYSVEQIIQTEALKAQQYARNLNLLLSKY